MPLYGIGTKVRGDPLGPSTLSALKSNADFVRDLALTEHMATGEHNAREVPRVVRRISGTTVSPSSTDITAVSNATTGKYVLTLASGRFDANWMAVQINPCGADVANKPYLVGYNVVSATSLEVYVKQLTSALGDAGGNQWAANAMDFDIAIHSSPLAVGSWVNALPSTSVIGDPMKPSRWNPLVQIGGELMKHFNAEHDIVKGLHKTRLVSSNSAMWRYNGTSFSRTAGVSTSLSVSRTSAGIYVVTSGVALTAQTHCFVSPDFARNNSGDPAALYRMHVIQNSTTQWTVYSYKHNRTLSTWDRADGDFWLAMHSG